MWQLRNDHHTGRSSWFHIVTQKEVFHEPEEAKGAILADDVSLPFALYLCLSDES